MNTGLPWWPTSKEPTYQCRRHGFSPWVEKIPWRRKWQPTPVFLPGKPHGQRSLAGQSRGSQKSRTRLSNQTTTWLISTFKKWVADTRVLLTSFHLHSLFWQMMYLMTSMEMAAWKYRPGVGESNFQEVDHQGRQRLQDSCCDQRNAGCQETEENSDQIPAQFSWGRQDTPMRWRMR